MNEFDRLIGQFTREIAVDLLKTTDQRLIVRMKNVYVPVLAANLSQVLITVPCFIL